MFHRIEDIECNKCGKPYQNTHSDVMSIMYSHCILSICPKCTEEVANLMGFTKDEITKKLAMIKKADTENNRLYAIEHGEVCGECKIAFHQGEYRVREDNCSNTKAWHLKCLV